MFIFSGLGFLVPILAFVAFLLTEYVTRYLTGDENYYSQHPWVIFVGALFGSALVFGLSRLLRQWPKPRTVQDIETGEVMIIHGNHSFFFIPVRFWPLLIIFLGATLMAAGPVDEPVNALPTEVQDASASMPPR